MRKIVPFTFYVVIFAAIAAYKPYLVLYYQSLNFTGAQIGSLVGIAPIITIFLVPIITGFADASNRHKLVLGILLLVTLASTVVLPVITTFLPMLIVITVSAVLWAPVMPLTNSATMYMLGEQRDLFGRIRLGGTLGFSVGGILVGSLVQNTGLRVAFYSASVLFILAFLVSLKFEHGSKEIKKKRDWSQAGKLLMNPHFLLFLVIGLSGSIAFTTINTYLFPYMDELGAPESMMGLALTFGTLTEIPVLFFINRFIKRFSAYAVLIFSLVMTVVRFSLLAIAPSATIVLLIQLLNGFNYPILSVAGVTYADEQAPPEFRATAQGLFQITITGIGSAIGGFIGGILFEGIGAKGMYLSFAIFVAIVLVVVSIVRQFLPPENDPRKVKEEVV